MKTTVVSGVQAKVASGPQSTPTGDQPIPRATHNGVLPVGDIPCAVLEASAGELPVRVLSERGVAKVFGKTGRSSPSWFRGMQGRSGPTLPLFISARNLVPYLTSTLLLQLQNPIIYQGKNGARTYGIEASLLGDICKVWIEAGRHGALHKNQLHIAHEAEILRDALVGVAIDSLVDDATGYVVERDREELYRILEKYIARELLPWTRLFPDDFYRELFRLRGWEYSPPSPKRPKIVGKLTNQLIYDKLPRGVLDELRQKNPIINPGYRRHKHFQFLTEDVGHPHLGKQIASVTTLMRASNSWSTFRRLFDRAFAPEHFEQLALFEEDSAEEATEDFGSA